MSEGDQHCHGDPGQGIERTRKGDIEPDQQATERKKEEETDDTYPMERRNRILMNLDRQIQDSRTTGYAPLDGAYQSLSSMDRKRGRNRTNCPGQVSSMKGQSDTGVTGKLTVDD